MVAYVGQTRAKRLIEEIRSYGWGEMVSRGELPPRRYPFALDNGVFGDWKAHRPFDEAAYLRDLDKLDRLQLQPDFLVVPDKIAAGTESLEFSLSWLGRLEGTAPLYLAVQDGMAPLHVEPVLRRFAGLFVGGTVPWKLRTARTWTVLAHDAGLRCHIGRVGTARRVRWARTTGADSIDSCVPLWSRRNLSAFRNALEAV